MVCVHNMLTCIYIYIYCICLFALIELGGRDPTIVANEVYKIL